MSDVFREVNEDLRREQLKKLWKRVAPFVIGGAVLIVVAVAGYQWYQSVQESEAADSGDRYQAAMSSYSDGDLEGALEVFLSLAEDGYADYPALARMAAGNIQAELGNVEAAAALFDAVAADSSTDDALRAAATMRAAFTLVGTAPFNEIRQRVEEFTEVGNAYRLLALEIMAVAAIDAGELDLALGWAAQMREDPFRGVDSDQRANLLLAYISSRLNFDVPADAAADTPAIPALGAEFPGFDAGDLEAGVPAFDATPVIDGAEIPGFANPAAADDAGFAEPDAVEPAEEDGDAGAAEDGDGGAPAAPLLFPGGD